jgi:trk system potassium uptake protein
MLGPIYLVTLSSAALFVLLVPSLLIAMAAGNEVLALEMGLLCGVGCFIALMVIAALSGRVQGVERELNFVSLVLIWIFTPLVAAIGLMVLTGLEFMPAWFEAASALTTTGASVLAKGNLPTGILFWRAAMEWYGGFLTLISIIHVLAPAGFGGLTPSGRRRGTAGQRDGHWGALSAYSSIFWQYGALTIIVALGLLFFSVEPGRAIMLAMVSIATGGFLPFAEPLEEHVGRGGSFVLALGLCFGTLSVFWRRNILRNPRRVLHGNREASIVLGIIAILTILYAARIADAGGVRSLAALGPVLLEGFFTASSLVSTSGIETRPGIIALLPAFLVLIIVLVGASVYSTTGGIKYYRVASMWIFAKAELNRLIFPSAVSSLKFGGQHVPDRNIRAVWSYFVLSLLCIAVGTVVITLTAANFEGGLAMAISLFANAGPAYDALRPVGEELAVGASGWPGYASLPPGAYVPAIILMTIGRLEVLIVFAVINVNYWLNR